MWWHQSQRNKREYKTAECESKSKFPDGGFNELNERVVTAVPVTGPSKLDKSGARGGGGAACECIGQGSWTTALDLFFDQIGQF